MDALKAADRNVFRMQQSNDRLCQTLREIAKYQNDENFTVANLGKMADRALKRRVPDDFSGMNT